MAWFLEGQEKMFFWFRNRPRRDNYAIQGWRKYKIYPDFIFTATDEEGAVDYQRVYVIETKGVHLIGSADTDYKKEVFEICNQKAQSRSLTELGQKMKDRPLRFEVLAESDWERKLNELLLA